MDVESVNNFFGDIDLPLLDGILQGLIPTEGNVLDIGCGQGRNGIYFIRNQSFLYTGIDQDKGAIELLRFVVNGSNASFETVDFLTYESSHKYSLVICSQFLHLLRSEDEFKLCWRKIATLLDADGVAYVALDSCLHNTVWKSGNNKHVIFDDGKERLPLTHPLYTWMIDQGFDEIQPVSTWIKQGRAQSFILLRKRQHP